jgi:hypothetical protein
VNPLFKFGACLLIAVTATTIGFGEEEHEHDTTVTPTNDLMSDFKDKIVLLEVNRSSVLENKSSTVMMQNVRIVKFGSRDFIVGTGYAPDDDEDYWNKDMFVGVPCESIVRFHAMTPTQFNVFLKKWREHAED